MSTKGQVSIPKGLRDGLGIHAGTILEFEAAQGRLIARKVEAVDPFARCAGVFADGQRSDDLLAGLRGEPGA